MITDRAASTVLIEGDLAGVNMKSSKRAGRITTFGFAVGAGLLIAAGAGAAVASAAPEDSGHTATSSAASSSSASSARSARPATGAAGKPKPTRIVTTGSDTAAPVVKLQTKPASAATAVSTKPAPASGELTSASAPVVKQAAAERVPTTARAPRAALDIARDLNTLRRNIELLIRHQIDDLRQNLTALRSDLAAIFAPARRPTNPDIPADETPGVIGTPRSREGYFIYQGQTNTCALSTAAMLIGQIYGRDAMPTWEQIVNEAATTPSYTKPGQPIYDRVNDTFVSTTDVLQLLQTHGVTPKSTEYTRGQGDLALTNLKAALTRGDAIAVSVKADIIWGNDAPDTAYTGDHLITVLGIDMNKNVVYVNDSAWEQSKGMGMALPMKVFLSGWAADSYTTITAVAAASSQTTLAA
ncbi:peptidase C39-like protein [Mycobacterium sp. BK086]|nr:peptidase C39-like protein [Mycobacterium sp. BK086]